MCELIQLTIKSHVWRTMKFLTKVPHADMLVTKVMRFSGLAELTGEKPEEIQKQQEWRATYLKTCVIRHNSVRGYVTGRIRKACLDYMDTKGEGKLPPVDEIRDCLMREIPENDGHRREIFVWYINDLLHKGAGNMQHWSETKRFFEGPSACITQDEQGKRSVPPSTEAFVLVAYEANIEVWQLQWLQYQEKGKKKKKIHTPRCKKDNIMSAEDKKWVSKFTSMDKGQNQFGGWSDEGLEKYQSYMEDNKKVRQTQLCAEVEQRGIRDLRRHLGITAVNAAAYVHGKKKRKATGGPAPVKEGIELVDEDE